MTYGASGSTVVLFNQFVSRILIKYDSKGVTHGSGSSNQAEQENSSGSEDLHFGFLELANLVYMWYKCFD